MQLSDITDLYISFTTYVNPKLKLGLRKKSILKIFIIDTYPDLHEVIPG